MNAEAELPDRRPGLGDDLVGEQAKQCRDAQRREQRDALEEDVAGTHAPAGASIPPAGRGVMRRALVKLAR